MVADKKNHVFPSSGKKNKSEKNNTLDRQSAFPYPAPAAVMTSCKLTAAGVFWVKLQIIDNNRKIHCETIAIISCLALVSVCDIISI